MFGLGVCCGPAVLAMMGAYGLSSASAEPRKPEEAQTSHGEGLGIGAQADGLDANGGGSGCIQSPSDGKIGID